MATACSSLSCLVVFVVSQGNRPFKWQQRTILDPSPLPSPRLLSVHLLAVLFTNLLRPAIRQLSQNTIRVAN